MRTTARSSSSSSRLTSPTYWISGSPSTSTRLCQPLAAKSSSRRDHSTMSSSPTTAASRPRSRVPCGLSLEEQIARLGHEPVGAEVGVVLAASAEAVRTRVALAHLPAVALA